MRRRVVITGSSFFSPMGHNGEDVISAMRGGETSFGRPEYDPEVVVSGISGFNLKAHTGRYKNARYINRGAAFGLASALEAVKDSGLTSDMLENAGIAAGVGPNLDLGGEVSSIREGKIDPDGLAALWILKFLPNTMASAIADLAGVHGESFSMSTACATTVQVIGEAFRKVSAGSMDVVLAGGGDSRINQGGTMAYRMAGALCTKQGDPNLVHRPFDCSRSGFVMGEGGGFLVLESLDHALERGAKILAEVCGFGASMDGGNMTAPEPTGRWMEKAVRRALDEAELTPGDIDVVSAHGTGTELNDSMEACMLERLFPKDSPHIIALKSWFGHLSTACGAVELSVCLSLMKHGFLPAVRNLENPVSAHLDFVRENRDHAFGTLLLQNFGFGGQNGAIVVKRYKG